MSSLSDMNEARAQAKSEIKLSLKWSNFCTRMVGLDFYQDHVSTRLDRMLQKCLFFSSTVAIVHIVLGEASFILYSMITSSRIEDVVGLIHLLGYAVLSMAKMATIWYKRGVFQRLLSDLELVWPVTPTGKEADIKSNSLDSLRTMHFWYFWINVLGVWSYILTPATVHVYLTLSGEQNKLGFPWWILYPFNKYTPGVREVIYAWEAFMGLVAVWTMVGPDLLFAALACHICMMLRLLHLRLRTLAEDTVEASALQTEDHFPHIVELIKQHQTLIRFCQDIEGAFTFVFLINMVLSSVNICCAGFVCILLEPLMSPSNKVFLVASLYQIGVLCWCGDDIYRANAEVGLAAYEGGWYRCDTRCRHALRLLILRSNKPLGFTAMKFKYLNLATYTSILTTSYSYFALLSTMYRGKD